jgi:hypothetical protein
MVSHSHSDKRLVRLVALLLCLALVTPFSLPARHLLAQDKPQAQRVIQGKVEGSSGAGLKGATVYLKDDHTLAVKSYIATDDGSFRFGQLLQSTDYELWSEFNGKKSSVKSISSFDTRAQIDITLKIDTK